MLRPEEKLRDVLLEMRRRHAVTVSHRETGELFSEQDVAQACQTGGRFAVSLVRADAQEGMLRDVLLEGLRRRILVVLHRKTGGLFSENDIEQICRTGGRFVVSLVPTGCRDNVRHMQRMVRCFERGIWTVEELPGVLEPALYLIAHAMAPEWLSAIRAALSHLAELNAGESMTLVDCRKAEAVQQIRTLVEAPVIRCDTLRSMNRSVREALWIGWYEYACVCCMTSQPRLMLEARETCISEEDAMALLNLLAEHYAFPPPKVTWGSGRRAWARPKEHRIHLSRRRRLNVGTVLHELAHLMATSTDRTSSGRRRVHTPNFVRALDQLLSVSSSLWMTGKFNYEQTMWVIATTHENSKMTGTARKEYRRRNASPLPAPELQTQLAPESTPAPLLTGLNAWPKQLGPSGGAS